MLLANGCKYEGAWNRGKMEGHGRLLYPNGDVYEGEWKAGSRNGYGKYLSLNGSMYEGEFKDGKRDGKGVQTTMNAGASNQKTNMIPFRLVEGERYDGEWKNGKRSGQAEVHIRGRLCYQGHFLNNERSGTGTAFFKDGTEYQGEWREGKMDGQGRMHSENGNAVEGVWERGICKQVLQGSLPDHLEKYSSNSELNTMQYFEKGKSRLLSHHRIRQDETPQPELGTDIVDGSMEGYDAYGMDISEKTSIGFLNNIDEGEESAAGAMRRMSISEAVADAHSGVAPREARAVVESLPAIYIGKERTGRMSMHPPGTEAARHEEMVQVAGRHGVSIRGGFDEDGNYIPPVTEQTFREWHTVNHHFLQAREAKRPGSRGGGTYMFDSPRQAGYGEGATPKLAMANLPRKTDALVAGPGTRFSPFVHHGLVLVVVCQFFIFSSLWCDTR